MNTERKFTRNMVGVVVVAAVSAALFWVITASDRMSERRNTARTVCTSGGGEWVKTAKHEMCVKAEVASKN